MEGRLLPWKLLLSEAGSKGLTAFTPLEVLGLCRLGPSGREARDLPPPDITERRPLTLELELVEARLECSDDIHDESDVDDVVPECDDVTDELSSELGVHILLHSELISCCTSSEFLAASLCVVSWYLSGVTFCVPSGTHIWLGGSEDVDRLLEGGYSPRPTVGDERWEWGWARMLEGAEWDDGGGRNDVGELVTDGV